jgi:hypothetical protein
VKAHTRAGKLRKFGLTISDYEALMTAQGGKCAICGYPPHGRLLAVDHLHVRGYHRMPAARKRLYVRGLLCGPCNRGLGHALDDVTLLQSAIRYLAEYAGPGV